MYKFLFFFLFLGIFASCSPTDSISVDNPITSRHDLLQQANPNRAFSSLTQDHQSLIWQDKLHNILDLPLSSEVLFQVESAIKELERQQGNATHGMSNNLAEVTKELLKLVPEQDFVEMFVSLEDYAWEGQFKGNSLCTDCYKKIKIQNELAGSLGAKAGPETGDDAGTSVGGEDKPDCNCNWGCDWFVTVGGGESCKGCKPTTSGCGPFGTSGCYRDYQIDGVC